MQFGALGYTPVPGDYDGDGITGIAVYNELAKNYAFSVYNNRALRGNVTPHSLSRPEFEDDQDYLWQVPAIQ